MSITKITQKGQITLPKDVRNKLHILPGDYLIIKVEKDKIILKPRGDIKKLRGTVKVKSRQNFKKLVQKANYQRAKDVDGEKG